MKIKKVKVKFTLEQATKPQRGVQSYSSTLSLTSALDGAVLLRERDAVPILQEVGWAPGPVWTGAENLIPSGTFFVFSLLCLYFIRTCFFVLIVLKFAFYLQHTTQTSMPPPGFELAISASERLQTYALDRAATGIGNSIPGQSNPQRIAIPTEVSLPTP